MVHNITNHVVMNTTANGLLALGASPVMAHATEELDEMLALAGALVINIGTLSREWVAAMQLATQLAAKHSVPIVLDPVGVGATSYRTQTAKQLLNSARMAVIRGNASEIMALNATGSGARGVDAQHAAEAALQAAHVLSEKYNCVVSVSGASDHIVQGGCIAKIHNGHPMMTRVTGLGCTASALSGAFCAINGNAFEAATHAMAVMGVCGELAMEQAQGPGSLQLLFLDALYNLNQDTLTQRLRMELT